MASGKTEHGHVQAEAFHVMRYGGKDGRREWLWNSRDGVTPFMIRSADEQVDMQHVDWHLDRYAPYFVPPIGSRIFADLTEERARPRAEAYVARWWNDPQLPMSAHPSFELLGRQGAVEFFVKEWVSAWGGHSPDVVVVTEAIHAQFAARAGVPGYGR